VDNEYTLGLVLLDCVPNLAFLAGGIFLVRLTLLTKRWSTVFPMVGGACLVFLGGVSKVVWKLIYTLGLGDPQLLSELQFVLLAPGFLMMLASVILFGRERNWQVQSALLAMAPWKIPFLATMTLCSLGTQGILAYLSFRKRAPVAGFLFVAAVLCMLSMAGMASGEQTVARQWIEESINAVGQIAFALGSYLLYRRYRAGARLAAGHQEAPGSAIPTRAL
jgi:hypothetical protein